MYDNTLSISKLKKKLNPCMGIFHWSELGRFCMFFSGLKSNDSAKYEKKIKKKKHRK